MTNDLPRRVWQRRNGVVPGFTRDHGCKLFVWFEAHDDIQQARVREAQMKKWTRREIEGGNPEWADLYANVAHP